MGRKRKYIMGALLLLLLTALGWYYHPELLYAFQYSRLKGLSYQTNGVNRSALSKIWAHRVNSLQRFDILKNDFEGMETDVMFDPGKNEFLIYHPPFSGHVLLLQDLLRE